YTEGRVYVPSEDGVVDYTSMMPLSDFIIYGYNGTEAERYADDNGLIFESLDTTGDLNGDGKLTMKDNVSIQKYLTGQKTLSKGELSRADICTDGRVNCFDLAEMKTEIINKRRNSDYQITIDQHFSLVSEKANSISAIKSKNEMISFLQDYISREDILAYSSKYNDEFFKDNVLILGAVFQSAGDAPLYDFSVEGAQDTLYVGCWIEDYDIPVEDVISRLIVQIVIPKEQFTFDNVQWTDTPTVVG
ncbi:MAG: dockerin type I repeat-containing protein, partial [Oscillospiraceae bacterium]|nr:dockerin type I repeat-containing protein [Oscillospiraceae bacterium]